MTSLPHFVAGSCVLLGRLCLPGHHKNHSATECPSSTSRVPPACLPSVEILDDPEPIYLLFLLNRVSFNDYCSSFFHLHSWVRIPPS